jgi:hypothetical protein
MLLSVATIAASLPGSPNELKSASIPPAMEQAFREWWSQNAYALEDGGCGDVVALCAALNAALPKA